MSLPDRKRLWARSGNRCDFSKYGRQLIRDIREYVETEDADEAVTIGEEAHIVAESGNGPRADPAMDKDERDAYPNRILVCEEHHKVIDSVNGKHCVLTH